MSVQEKCPICGSTNIIVARDMHGTRHCSCGRTWLPEQVKAKEEPKMTNEIRDRIEKLVGEEPVILLSSGQVVLAQWQEWREAIEAMEHEL